jgi:hypothetical protein
VTNPVLCRRGRSLPLIFATSLPKIKAFLRPASLAAATQALLVRLLTACLHHPGRMAASCAAAAVRTQARPRAQLVRFLARRHWARDGAVLRAVAELLLAREPSRAGRWRFLLDQTHVGQQGRRTENTVSRANYRPRAKKGNRKPKRYAKRSCHGFVCGLLLTPSGLRLPGCRSYYTEASCQARGRPYRTQPELAAELIRDLAVPQGADVVVRGDTAYEARDLRAAGQARRCGWVVPVNPERVLATPKPRPQVRARAAGLAAEHFEAVRLVPGRGRYARQARAAAGRVGPQAKARVYYAPAERRAVRPAGDVLRVFATKEPPQAGRAVPVPKVRMTDRVGWGAAPVVAAYALRWQVEINQAHYTPSDRLYRGVAARYSRRRGAAGVGPVVPATARVPTGRCLLSEHPDGRLPPRAGGLHPRAA